MLILWDVNTKQPLSQYESIEDAAMAVGAIMSVQGTDALQNKYVLTDPPLKSGKAKIVVHPQDLFGKALTYFNESYFEAHKGTPRIAQLLGRD